MKQSIPTYRKTLDKEANTMASNDVEVLDPATPVEKSTKIASGNELDRRHFIAALGVAGAAAGTALMVAPRAEAQQPSNPSGYAQVDVLNLLLQVKYLKATLYSYITQGTDLPASSYVTLGTGEVFNQPAKIPFSSQQITDVFNEMYYDELQQLIALRSIQGVAVANRSTMNLLGTGPSGTAPSTTTTTLTQAQAIGLARMLEDLSASAFATATIYLTGTNLAYATQALATDGYHAGLIRLLAIQTGAQIQATEYAASTTSNTAQTPVTFYGLLTAGSNAMYAYLGAATLALPAVGNPVSGIGIPEGAVITSVTGASNTSFVGVITSGKNTITGVSSVAGLKAGQIITTTGTGIPANTTITNVGTNTITMSVNASGTPAAITPTGFVTLGSNTIMSLSSISGLIVGQQISGAGIPTGATITAINTTAPLSITISANATANSVTSGITGIVTAGSPVITSVSAVSGFAIGADITGVGIPAGATVVATTNGPNTITLSVNATVTSASAESLAIIATVTVTATGTTQTVGTTAVTFSTNASVSSVNTIAVIVPDNQDVYPAEPGTIAASTTSGSPTVTVLSVAGLASGQAIIGPGIPAATTITAVSSSTLTITLSAPATATSPGVQLIVPALAASGPSVVPGSSPSVYQGFFPTAGAATSSGSQPAGTAFARTFQQVLAVLYGYNSTNSAITTQSYEGGFYPFGVGGQINSAI
jgi:hypothetical protein